MFNYQAKFIIFRYNILTSAGDWTQIYSSLKVRQTQAERLRATSTWVQARADDNFLGPELKLRFEKLSFTSFLFIYLIDWFWATYKPSRYIEKIMVNFFFLVQIKITFIFTYINSNLSNLNTLVDFESNPSTWAWLEFRFTLIQFSKTE